MQSGQWSARARNLFAILTVASLLFVFAGPVLADEPAGAPAGEPNLAEIGAKLSNPVSDVWAMFTQFSVNFSDGDINEGDPQVGGSLSFQPILPIPISEKMKLIVRPTVPVFFENSVPQGLNEFDSKTGLGDTLLPLVFSPEAGNLLIGVGPTLTLPTSTKDAFGRQQWAIGPTGIVGYKTKDWVGGVFPQYFLGVGSRGDKSSKTPKANYMSMLYFFFYNMPDAWQVGFNPAISYDHKASHGNKWNVPVGLVVAKTTKIGNVPTKFQFGVEYSVVSQDDFGTRALLKLNIIPVIPSLISTALF